MNNLIVELHKNNGIIMKLNNGQTRKMNAINSLVFTRTKFMEIKNVISIERGSGQQD